MARLASFSPAPSSNSKGYRLGVKSMLSSVKSRNRPSIVGNVDLASRPSAVSDRACVRAANLWKADTPSAFFRKLVGSLRKSLRPVPPDRSRRQGVRVSSPASHVPTKPWGHATLSYRTLPSRTIIEVNVRGSEVAILNCSGVRTRISTGALTSPSRVCRK